MPGLVNVIKDLYLLFFKSFTTRPNHSKHCVLFLLLSIKNFLQHLNTLFQE